MEIPAKNTIGFNQIERVTFTSGTNEKPSFLHQNLLFSIFCFCFCFDFFFIKITPKPLLWAKYDNFNKRFHLKVSAGNLDKR